MVTRCQLQLSVLLFASALLIGQGAAVQALEITAATEEPQAAEMTPEVTTQVAQQAPAPRYALIYVSAVAGQDIQGDGSQFRPLRTITHALRIASPNTIIVLAPGVYSAASGETFPIQLRPGVTVQGMPGPSTAEILIQGNALHPTASQGLRNITLLGSDRAGLANVTVSNPHPGGYGLWIEAGSPSILENAFVRNGSTGIYVAGAGAPVIQRNYFLENGDAGLVIAGASSAQVQGNVFENTGTGISVAPGATPQISDNRITRNQDGLLLHADARPVLGNNQISQNRRNSVVDYASWAAVTPPAATGAAVPDRAPAAAVPRTPLPEPQGQTDGGLLPPGNTATAPVESPVAGASTGIPSTQLPPRAATIATPPPAVAAVPPLTAPAAEVLPEPAVDAVDPDPLPLAAIPEPEGIDGVPAAAAPDPAATAALQERIQQRRAELAAAQTAAAVEIPSIPPAAEPEAAIRGAVPSVPAVGEVEQAAASPAPEVDRTAALRARLQQRQEEMTTSEFPDAIALTITPPPVDTVAAPAALPPETPLPNNTAPVAPTIADLPILPPLAANPGTARSPEDILNVPSSTIPLGNGGGSLPDVFVSGAATAPTAGPPPPPTRSTVLGLSYKVFVPAADEATQNRVRAIVPDAFRVRVNGQVMMQAGAYSTQAEAQTRADQLTQSNLPARVEYIP